MTSSPPGSIPNLPPPPAPRWDPIPEPDAAVAAELAHELNLPDPLCRLLAVRGFADPESARSFLRPRLDALPSAENMADVSPAVERIRKAVQAGETIFVHGDYDVDGICATALLTGVLREHGATVVPFVPHRLRDGYDLGRSGLEAAEAAGASLLVTVDCGVRAHEAVAEAGRRGMDVVVTDHHTPAETLPDALAVVNPNRADCSYPNPHLCGAGVAYKVAQLLASRMGASDPLLPSALDLVGLATVADVVPLTGENRTLVRYGLRVLQETRRPGLQALLAVTGLSDGDITAGRVGFVLAPRLNAAGRVGETRDALDLLLTGDGREARDLARRLEDENARRRAEDERTLAEALALLAGSYDPERDYGVVLAGEGWHPGVIGIVASRVAERIHRPAILVALEGGRGRGSARSIPGFHLLDAVTACSDHLDRFGGHAQAAGMDVDARVVDDFREAFREEARRRLESQELRPVLRPDLELRLPEVTDEFVRYLQYTAPFGVGNRRPLFLSRGARIEDARVVGSGHLKVRVRQDGRSLDGIGFGLAGRISPAQVSGGDMDVAYSLEENHYRGRVSLQARVRDIRPSGAGA